ncbi:MAG TPA: hypothetical protein VMQ93_18365 [Novosphingobium sp.]|nr:hypothetical protein [Novosphingobium sp.]
MTEFDPKRTTSAPTSGFEFNNPTIINLLYLASYVTGVTGIVGVVLAYVWRGEPKAEWEVSHYEYAIRTFWIFLVGVIVGTILTIVLIGIPILIAVSVLVIVRCVLSVLNAQKHAPMPNPGTWLA